MTDPKKDPQSCLHFSISRIPSEERKGIVELNGKGLLKPGLRCDECQVVFYTLEPSRKKPSKG